MKMKNIRFYALLALLLTVGSVTMQAQDYSQETREYYPLIPKNGNKQWDICLDYYSNYSVMRLGDDFDFEGKHYRKLIYEMEDQNHTIVLFCIMREENKKVYLRQCLNGVQQFGEEILYYDFNLQVGDLFDASYYGEQPEYIELMAVEEVVMEDGSVRNKYIFNEGWENTEVWIEGVGSLAGINWRYIPSWAGTVHAQLQCYFEDEALVLTGGACWDDVKEIAVENISLYPNPTNSIARIEGITVSELQIYNTFGQLVNTVLGTNEISVTGLPEGVYLLRVTTMNGKIYRLRLIVEKL